MLYKYNITYAYVDYHHHGPWAEWFRRIIPIVAVNSIPPTTFNNPLAMPFCPNQPLVSKQIRHHLHFHSGCSLQGLGLRRTYARLSKAEAESARP